MLYYNMYIQYCTPRTSFSTAVQINGNNNIAINRTDTLLLYYVVI